MLAPSNTAPVANDDYYSTKEDKKLKVNASGVLTNDAAPADGDPLQVELVPGPRKAHVLLKKVS